MDDAGGGAVAEEALLEGVERALSRSRDIRTREAERKAIELLRTTSLASSEIAYRIGHAPHAEAAEPVLAAVRDFTARLAAGGSDAGVADV